jgi:ElaB/YqjD/DUF883 family membrane-anchored ribosome-binding protein
VSVTPEDLTMAEARQHAARARLLMTLGEMQQRLSPAHLAQDAVESAAQGVASVARKGAEAVRNRPLATAGIVATIGLVMARGWIADIIGGAKTKNETGKPAAGLKPKRKAKEVK